MIWHDYFTYEPETGNLIWKERPREQFASHRAFRTWNSRYAGKNAGHAQHKGAGMSVYVRVHNKMHRAHRIVWEMHHGAIPHEMLIDHIDGDYENNRLSNLRLATKSENGQNRGYSVRNQLRLKGVSFQKSRGKFTAMIKPPDGKHKNLGRFDLKCLAASAYAKASLRHHGKFSPFYRKFASL